MPYVVGQLVQDGMFDKVRDHLGASTTELPDTYLAGLPQDIVTTIANRRVPSWPTLGQSQRTNLDVAIQLDFVVQAIERLRTLEADGEGTTDAHGGRYYWDERQKRAEALAASYWNRAQIENGAVVEAGWKPFAPFGRSKADAYGSPDPWQQQVAELVDPFSDLKAP
jgi:hypothetical protein